MPKTNWDDAEEPTIKNYKVFADLNYPRQHCVNLNKLLINYM